MSSTQKSGSGVDSGSKRPPSSKPNSGRPKPASAKGRSVSASGKTGSQGGKRPGGNKPNARRPQSSRFSPAYLAYGAIGLVVILIVVFVVVKVSGGGSNPTGSDGIPAPTLTPASASVLSKVTGVTPAIENAVGVQSSLVTTPTIEKSQPALTINGLPGAVFVGAEFCPYCGAERWALIMTFSRFGSFSGLKETTSSPWDTDPSTPTFSFHGAKYTSKYVDFAPVEQTGNDTTGLGTRKTLDTPTKQQSELWSKYGTAGSFPFVDIGNILVINNPSYDPAILAGLDQSQVASNLTNPKSQITQAIVGTANYMTAAVCKITNQQPSSVCSVSGVQKAASALGIK